MFFKWLALKEFKPSGGGGVVVLPDYLPTDDLQLELEGLESDMERVEGDIRIQRINLTRLLTSGNYSLTNINNLTDAKFTIKSGDAVIIEKTITNTELVKDVPNQTVVVTFKPADFAPNKLQKNKSYGIGFGIKYGALTEFVPVTLTFSSSNLKILPNPLI